MTNSQLVTTTQAVEITGQSRWSLYRLMKTGVLTPVMKTPASTGTYFFNRSDVEALAKPEDASSESEQRAS